MHGSTSFQDLPPHTSRNYACVTYVTPTEIKFEVMLGFMKKQYKCKILYIIHITNANQDIFKVVEYN